MATCILSACFDGKHEKQLEVSGLQAIVLLAFNDKNELCYPEIEEITGLKDRDLNI
jgi:hypothetical protein